MLFRKRSKKQQHRQTYGVYYYFSFVFFYNRHIAILPLQCSSPSLVIRSSTCEGTLCDHQTSV